uniref:Methyltransferase n=1 Tax=viral metagenome TaxID=1070528 RepID=A0A6C0KU93_9ZZZZ
MERSHCVFCNNTLFSFSFYLINTINIISINKFNPNELKKLKFISCKNCGCVQLQNLFLQSDLYLQPLQIFDGNAYITHNNLFCEFVTNNINFEEKLFEIGGSYGKLAKLIIQKYKENNKEITYKILEYDSTQYPEIDNIEYISYDCELYDYNNINTIIMSHVFEHLYNPRKFIEKISNTNVKNIFISIPDMDNLLKNNDINNLNILHTYYINTGYLVSLMSKNGFKMLKMFNYTNNSIFYYFNKNINTDIIEYTNLNLPKNQKLFYKKMKLNIKNIIIEEPFFICPSGFYGQFIYFNLNKNTRSNLRGFLDSDIFKINKRLSGTKMNIFEKNEISNYNKITVLISSVKHNTEIKKELSLYNNNIIFIEI